MKLKNKIAIVTGASNGIGRTIAKMLVINGAKVIGTSTSKKGADYISDYLGVNGKGIELNLLNIQLHTIQSWFQKLPNDLKNPDILVNNIGITSDNLLIKMKQQEWQSIIDINLSSVFFMSKAVIKSMLKNRFGRIINIGSMIGAIGNKGQVNYAAAKAGLIGLSKSLAREVASRGITVNVIAPGFITTNLSKSIIDKKYNTIIDQIPMKRIGEPIDIANVVIFLASADAAYITGETIHVNGGMYMS